MASGPEHYQAAERCLSSVQDDSELSLALLAEAQVHATLALAAATALYLSIDPAHERRPEDEDAWSAVACTRKATS